MNPILKNVLAVITGLLVGNVVNMGIIMMSGTMIPPPEGADVTTVEGLKDSMHLFTPINFLMPLLAHALGSFAGAWVAAMIAATHKMKFAISIGTFFLIGGIYMVTLVPSPVWFTVLDLGLAYIPMAWLAGKLVASKS